MQFNDYSRHFLGLGNLTHKKEVLKDRRAEERFIFSTETLMARDLRLPARIFCLFLKKAVLFDQKRRHIFSSNIAKWRVTKGLLVENVQLLDHAGISRF
jgi:hypothetical protein